MAEADQAIVPQLGSLAGALSLVAGKPVRAELVDIAASSYVLELHGLDGQPIVLHCYRAEPDEWGHGSVHALLKSVPPQELIPLPGGFVRRDGPAIRGVHSTEMPSRLRCDIDLLGLVSWTLGYDASLSEGTANWSHVAWAGPAWTTSFAYLDELLEEIVRSVGIRPACERADSPSLIVTGDTDDATERHLMQFLQCLTDADIPATLLVRRCEQLTETVVDALGTTHSVGVHPWARTNDVADFLRDLRELSAGVRSRTGSDPIAIRHHRFQWFDPAVVRAAARLEGIRFELNLVAASDQTWIGAPTGVARPLPAFGDDARSPLWLVPTCVEDDVFLYNEPFCFVNSGDPDRDFPQGFLFELLDYWTFTRRYPVCVNLHPEHCTDELGWVMGTLLAWRGERDASCVRLADWLTKLDQAVVT